LFPLSADHFSAFQEKSQRVIMDGQHC